MWFLLVFQTLVVIGFVVGLFLEELSLGYFAMFGLAIFILVFIIYRLKHPVSQEVKRQQRVRKQRQEYIRQKQFAEKERKKRIKKHELDWIDEMEFFDAIFDDR